jgi:hypothetical protein
MRITLLAVLAAQMCLSARGDEPLDKKVQQFLDAKYSFEASEVLQGLFKTVGTTRLKLHPDDTVALHAAWQEVLLTIPEVEPKEVVIVDRGMLNWFLGFLEGRVRAQIPEWWKKELLDARANRRDNVYFRGVHAPSRVPADTKLKKENGRLMLDLGNASVPIAESVIRKYGPRSEISALVTSRRCLVAVHSHVGFGFPVTCVDRATGKVLWQAKTEAVWWIPFYSGSGFFNRVTITEQDSRVVVFGVANSGAYVEAFRADDGKRLFRFATYP